MTVYVMEHPASLLPHRSPHLRDVMDLDFRRLTKLLTGWRPTYRDDFKVLGHWTELNQWFDHHKPKRVAIDLEWNARQEVDMVGMAVTPQDARLLALPDEEGLHALWNALARHGSEVVVHYGEGLELPWLLENHPSGIPFRVHDLHKLFHAWDTEYASAGRDQDDRKEGGGSGALAFIQSLYTWRPYHKHLLGRAAKTFDFSLKTHYCMLDCVVTWEAFCRIEELLKAELPMSHAAYERDAVPLLVAMAKMNRLGWLVDKKRFAEKKKELTQTAKDQAEALVALYGEAIKPKGKKARTLVSVAGLKTVLTAQGIVLPKKRRDDGRTTETLDREARQKLIEKYPELSALDAYWETQDLLSDCYKDIVSKDGRCHASWSGYLSSWRWRCTKPNIAQWPEAERDIFVADVGHVLVQFDTSAGEYRWFAGESGDPALLDVFRQYDACGDSAKHPHVVNTSVLFATDRATAATWKNSKDPHEKAKYTFSKNYIYRLMYSYEGGIDELRATAAKAGLKFSRKDIADFDKTWFAKFPVAAAWRERQARQTVRTRLVTCRAWGYTRRLHGQDEAKLKNIALNHPQQAGIAGIINKTVLRVDEEYGILPLANMHDGLIYQFPEGKMASLIPRVKAIMEEPLASVSGIVIPVDIKVGPAWGAHMEEWRG